MALKGNRFEDVTDISFFMNEVAERGGMTSFSTVGSGAALDQALSLVTYAASSSGKVPAGILLNDMVDIDLTRYHLNPYKDEVQKGSKVTLLRRGWVLTNKVVAGITVTATSNVAYMAYSGLFTNVATNASDKPPVGRFLSSGDEDGYYKVDVNLPGIHANSNT